jgi:hypothetical protein
MIQRRMLRRLALLGVLMLGLSGCAVNAPYADDAAIAAVSYRDPGPATITVITVVNNRNGSGGHSAIMINASERVIFDPAGSFYADIVPERNDVLYGITPRVEQAYRSAHARSAYHVVSQTVEVTPEQAEIALQLAKEYGAVPSAFCTIANTSILKQVPGFENITSTFFPTRLMDQMAQIPGVKTERYYEDDEDDLQAALVAGNAALSQ